jgi:hypothetical protein
LNKGHYADDYCEKLTISLLADTLTIEKENCDAHGARCSFEGKYEKTNRNE